MKNRIELSYKFYATKRFRGIIFLIDTDCPRWYKKGFAIEIRLGWVGFWVNVITQK